MIADSAQLTLMNAVKFLNHSERSINYHIYTGLIIKDSLIKSIHGIMAGMLIIGATYLPDPQLLRIPYAHRQMAWPATHPFVIEFVEE